MPSTSAVRGADPAMKDSSGRNSPAIGTELRNPSQGRAGGKGKANYASAWLGAEQFDSANDGGAGFWRICYLPRWAW